MEMLLADPQTTNSRTKGQNRTGTTHNTATNTRGGNYNADKSRTKADAVNGTTTDVQERESSQQEANGNDRTAMTKRNISTPQFSRSSSLSQQSSHPSRQQRQKALKRLAPLDLNSMYDS